MYFGTKNYLKSNRYHTTKHTLNLEFHFGLAVMKIPSRKKKKQKKNY